MLRSILIFLCVLMMGLRALPAMAANFSGEYLLQVCASDEHGNEISPGGHIACQAYIAGVVDYHILTRTLGTAPSIDFCLPEKVSLNTLQNIVFVYLVRNKHEQGPFIAAPSIGLALSQAYPCKGKRAKKKVR